MVQVASESNAVASHRPLNPSRGADLRAHDKAPAGPFAMLLDTARPTPEPAPIPRGDRQASGAVGRDRPADNPRAETAPTVRHGNDTAAKTDDTPPQAERNDTDAGKDTKDSSDKPAADTADDTKDGAALAVALDTADANTEPPKTDATDVPQPAVVPATAVAAPMQPLAEIQAAPDVAPTAGIEATADRPTRAVGAPKNDQKNEQQTGQPADVQGTDAGLEPPVLDQADAKPQGDAKASAAADEPGPDIAAPAKIASDAVQNQSVPASDPPAVTPARDAAASDANNVAAPETTKRTAPESATPAVPASEAAAEPRAAKSEAPAAVTTETPETLASTPADKRNAASETPGIPASEPRNVIAPQPRVPHVVTEPAGHAGDTAAKPGAEAMPNLGLALPASHTATVAGPANPPTSPAAVAVPLAGLAVAIAHEAQAGKNRFDIRLDPPELGRIDVRLDVDRDGNVSSRLVVERPETLDLLRRDASQLERALQQAGLKTSDNALEFSLRGQAFGRDPETPRHVAQLIIPEDDAAPLEAVRHGYGRLLGLGGGIDIRV